MFIADCGPWFSTCMMCCIYCRLWCLVQNLYDVVYLLQTVVLGSVLVRCVVCLLRAVVLGSVLV